MDNIFEDMTDDMTVDELLALRKKLNEKLRKGPENVAASKVSSGRVDNLVGDIVIVVKSDGPKIDTIKSRKGEGELIATSRGWQKVEGADNISYNLNVTRWR